MSDDAGISPETRVALNNRCRGRCEWCGQGGKRLEAHHRLYRSRGGRHDASNLVMLCGWGNTLGCHGRAHGAAPGDLESAERAGITLHAWQDAEHVPIRSVVFGLPMYLARDGSSTFDPPRRT